MTSAKIRELQAEVEEGELGRARTMELVADNERLEAELEQLHGPRDCPTRRPPALTRGPRAETCAGPATVTIRVMQTSLTIREAFRGVRRGSPARVAQLAEQLSCKQQVRSSILLSGSRFQGFSALGTLRIRRLLIPC